MVGPGPAITGPPGESMEAQFDSFIAKPAQLRSGSKTNNGNTKSSEQNEPHQKKGTNEVAKHHKDYALFTS